MHPLAHLGLVQQVHGALLEHAGADAPFDIVRGSGARRRSSRCPAKRQQARQQQPGRSGADDADLRFVNHGLLSRFVVGISVG